MGLTPHLPARQRRNLTQDGVPHSPALAHSGFLPPAAVLPAASRPRQHLCPLGHMPRGSRPWTTTERGTGPMCGRQRHSRAQGTADRQGQDPGTPVTLGRHGQSHRQLRAAAGGHQDLQEERDQGPRGQHQASMDTAVPTQSPFAKRTGKGHCSVQSTQHTAL